MMDFESRGKGSAGCALSSLPRVQSAKFLGWGLGCSLSTMRIRPEMQWFPNIAKTLGHPQKGNLLTSLPSGVSYTCYFSEHP